MSTPPAGRPSSRTPPTCRRSRSRARRCRGPRARRERRSRPRDVPEAPGDLVQRPLAGGLASVYSASSSSRVAVAAASSDQPIGEREADLALGGLGRVRAVNEVVRHRERELTAERARVGVGRVRRADRLRAVAIAPSPSSTNASVGPEVMKSTSSPKNGFSTCSA